MVPSQPSHSRRKFLINMPVLSATAIFAPFVITPSRSASKQITIRDVGGVIARYYQDILYRPFTQATGIKVISISERPEPTAEIRTMVETERYLWDMAALSDVAILLLSNNNIYLEKHELEHDPVVSSIPPQFMSPYGVGTNVYTMGLAYRTDAFKGHRVPVSWRDLWDVDYFPGRRGLRKHPFDTLESALLADGVPPHNLYPCDFDRAFRRLDKIKPHIAIWWTSGPQTEQILKTGEVDLTLGGYSRVQSAIDAGAPIAFSWEQHLYGCENWAILKGTPHADLCRQFIRFALDPKRQALLAPYTLGPTQPDALNHVEPNQAKRLIVHPDNLKRGLRTNASYWVKYQQAAIERFNDWLVS